MTVYERMTREGVESGIAFTPDAERLIEQKRVNALAHKLADIAALLDRWAQLAKQNGCPALSLAQRETARELARIAVALDEGEEGANLPTVNEWAAKFAAMRGGGTV